MQPVLVFGGTSEGRELVEWLSKQRAFEVTVCTATEYGAELVSELAGVRVVQGRLGVEQMTALMRDLGGPSGRSLVVVDATHPYAVAVTKNIAAAASSAGVACRRLVRDGGAQGDWVSCADAAQAAETLRGMPGNILLTTGSKDLATFTSGIPDYRERLFVRILPAAESLLAAHELDIPLDHIVAMQGPFSEQLNMALIREFDIRVLVTKASGARGGFWEKASAAKACGSDLVVIQRPVVEDGYSLEDIERLLSAGMEG